MAAIGADKLKGSPSKFVDGEIIDGVAAVVDGGFGVVGGLAGEAFSAVGKFFG
jgi:hypothetical protein